MSSHTEELVQDGRLRVDNFDVMQAKGPRRFNWLRIDANNNCNLKCTYCRVPRSTSLIDADHLKEFLSSYVVGVENLQFGCGMEPTLDSRLADLMTMAATTPARPNNQFVVQTNGTLLHQHDHEKLANAGLNRLSVSIDSLDPKIHRDQRGGSNIEQIIRNLKSFQANCPHIEIQLICVVTSASINSTLDLARFAVDLGVKRMTFRQMVYVPNHPNVVEEDVVPLIVNYEDFDRMQQAIESEIGNAMEMSFYSNEDLAEHRKTMRSDSYFTESADKPFLSPLKNYEPDEDLLKGKRFFVLRGFMRSGTNWICRLLNLHPKISCAGEFHWQKLTGPFVEYLDNSDLVNHKEGLRHAMWMRLDRMMKECMVLANHPDAIWVGDRTPAHITPGVIQESKIFNVIRDVRDVAVSRTYHFFNHPQLFPKFAAMSENQRRVRAFRKDAQFFIKNPGELFACEEFLKETLFYWNETIHINKEKCAELSDDRYFEVRYEAVHADVDSERSRMYRFLEQDPKLAAPLGFNTNPGFEKEMPERFLRKGQVGDWINYVTQSDAHLINEYVGDTLLELGYIDSLDWAQQTQCSR